MVTSIACPCLTEPAQAPPVAVVLLLEVQRGLTLRGRVSFCRQVRRVDAASGIWWRGIGPRCCEAISAAKQRVMLRGAARRDAWFRSRRGKARRAWMTGAATRPGGHGSRSGDRDPAIASVAGRAAWMPRRPRSIAGDPGGRRSARYERGGVRPGRRRCRPRSPIRAAT